MSKRDKIKEFFLWTSMILVFFIIGLTLGWIGVGVAFAWFFLDSFFMKYTRNEFHWKDWFELRLSLFAFISSLLGLIFYSPM